MEYTEEPVEVGATFSKQSAPWHSTHITHIVEYDLWLCLSASNGVVLTRNEANAFKAPF